MDLLLRNQNLTASPFLTVICGSFADVWSISIGSLRYLLGHFLKLISEEMPKYEIWVIAFIGPVGAVLWPKYWLTHRSTRTS